MRLCTPADAPIVAVIFSYVGPDVTILPPSVDELAKWIAAETWVLDEATKLIVRLVVDDPKAPPDATGKPIRVWPKWIMPVCGLKTQTTDQFNAAFKLLAFACTELLKKQPKLATATCGGALRGTMLDGFKAAGGQTVAVTANHTSVYNTVQFVIDAAAKATAT